MPYPVLAYSGMVLWQLFSHALTESSNSLVGNERLITKVYFPRLVIPLSAVLGGLVDFVIAFIVLIPFLAFYRIAPTVRVLALPLFALLAALVALGAGIWLAALNVKYRDVRYTVGFLVQLWFLATPVAYPASVVPQRWQAWYGLNPMVGVVEGFRWALLGVGRAPGHLLVGTIIVIVVVLGSGLYYFRRMEASFADVI
jgi:lipopolysaccharide transport system permease protein